MFFEKASKRSLLEECNGNDGGGALLPWHLVLL